MSKPWCPDLLVKSIIEQDERLKQREEEQKGEVYTNWRGTAFKEDGTRIKPKTHVTLKDYLTKDQIHPKAKEKVLRLMRLALTERPRIAETVAGTDLETAYANLGKCLFSMAMLQKVHEVIQDNSTRTYTPWCDDIRHLHVQHAHMANLCMEIIYALQEQKEKTHVQEHASKDVPL